MEQRDQSKGSPKADFENIPIIDVAPLKSPDREARQKLAAEIYDACTQVGFFYIKVTFVSPESQIAPLVNRSLAESRDL